jgi:hypothetical protein
MALADLDGDLDLDVVLARAGEVEVLLGDGAGALAAGAVFPTGLGDGPQRLAAGDLDGDGEPDLAVLRDAPVGELALLFGQDAKFMSPMLDVFGAQPGALWLGDVDDDEHDDLLSYNAAGASTLSLRAGDGQGGLAPEVGVYADPLQAPAAGPSQDGTLAVVRPRVSPDSVALELLRYDAGSFGPTRVISTTGTTPISAAGFALFEGSGELDLFALRDLQGATALQMWYGGTTMHEAVIGGSKAIGGVGDVDGDAFADLVTFTPGEPGSRCNSSTRGSVRCARWSTRSTGCSRRRSSRSATSTPTGRPTSSPRARGRRWRSCARPNEESRTTSGSPPTRRPARAMHTNYEPITVRPASTRSVERR